MRLLENQPYRGRAVAADFPIGRIILVENGSALTHLLFDAEDLPPGAEMGPTPLLLEALEQLDAYFKGERRDFDLPLAPFGTDFQLQVWAELLKIPYGQTISYGEAAEAVGRPGGGRAVGQASNRNPIGIIIPCHRVVGRDGQLTGYGGGLEAKEYLLRLEDDVVHGRALFCPPDDEDA